MEEFGVIMGFEGEGVSFPWERKWGTKGDYRRICVLGVWWDGLGIGGYHVMMIMNKHGIQEWYTLNSTIFIAHAMLYANGVSVSLIVFCYCNAKYVLCFNGIR